MLRPESITTCKVSGRKSINMRIEKHNTLPLLFSGNARCEAFGEKSGVLVRHIPFGLRSRLLKWMWLYDIRERYFFNDAGRLVVTIKGWEHFIHWIEEALDEKLAKEQHSSVQQRRLKERKSDGRLVTELGLVFPYDWSNRGGIKDEALIINVLKRGIYEDICRICAYYGIETVDNLADVAFKNEPSMIYPRMIENIRKGFEEYG
ncbi:MAG: hypothetical protein ACXV8Q_00350 [Methylobacter sp.]